MKLVAQGFHEVSSYLPPEGISHSDEFELGKEDAEYIAHRVLESVAEYVAEIDNSVDTNEWMKAMQALAENYPEAFMSIFEIWEKRRWVDSNTIITDMIDDGYFDQSDDYDE